MCNSIENASLVRPELERAHWYRDPMGALFIVPDVDLATAGIEGPAGEMLDRLASVYRRCNSEGVPFEQVDTESIARVLELEIVEKRDRVFDATNRRFFAAQKGRA